MRRPNPLCRIFPMHRLSLVFALFSSLWFGIAGAAAEPPPLRTALLAWEPVPARADVQRVAGDLVALVQAELSAEPGVAWVERTELDKLLAEADLAASGRLDPRASLRVGKLARAQLLVTGRLDASDFTRTTLALDVIDLDRGDLLASSVTTIPPRPHKHYDLRDEDRATAVAALRTLLAQASARHRELAAKPALAFLFLANSGPSSRLDAAGERLASSLRDSATNAGARVLNFPRARDTDAEQDLAILGLAEADDQAWRGVADLYAWGEYKELPSDGLAFEQTPVEASLTLWDGASAPRTVPWNGTVATFPEAAAAFSAALASALRHTPDSAPEARADAARLIFGQVTALERKYAGSREKNDFWTSEVGRNFQRHRVYLLQTAAFLEANNTGVRRALFAARWDRRGWTRALSLDELWLLHTDLYTITERFPDPDPDRQFLNAYQRGLRVSNVWGILHVLCSLSENERAMHYAEIRHAARIWSRELQALHDWAKDKPGAAHEYEAALRDQGDNLLGLGNGPRMNRNENTGIARQMLDETWPILTPAVRQWFDKNPSFGAKTVKNYVDIYALFGEEDAAYRRILAALAQSPSDTPSPLVAKKAAEPEPADRPAQNPEWSAPPEECPAALGPRLPLVGRTLYRWKDAPSGAEKITSYSAGRPLLAADAVKLLGFDGRRLWTDGFINPESRKAPDAKRLVTLLAPDTRDFTEIGAPLPGESRAFKTVIRGASAYMATAFDGLLRIGPGLNEIQHITPDAGLPSLQLGALGGYDGGVIVAAAAPEQGVARYDETSGRWLNLEVPDPGTMALTGAGNSSREGPQTLVAGLGPWIMVGRFGVHLFDTRTGAWSSDLAALRLDWIKQQAEAAPYTIRLRAARQRGDDAEIKRLLATPPQMPQDLRAARQRGDLAKDGRILAEQPQPIKNRHWATSTPLCILADKSAFWVGGEYGLARYDPSRPPQEVEVENCPPVQALADAGRWLWVAFYPMPAASSGLLPGFASGIHPHSLPHGKTDGPEWRRSRIALYDKINRRWVGSLEVSGGITSLAAAPGYLWAAGSTLLEFDTRSITQPDAQDDAPPSDPMATGLGLAALPLQKAVSRRDYAGLRQLLAAGAPVDACAAEGWTALHLAARLSDHEAVDLLLNAGADLHKFTRDGRDALGFAAAEGDLPLVRRLIGAGADPRRQARLHLPRFPGPEPALTRVPTSAPPQPIKNAVEALADGRVRVKWEMAPDCNQDGFAIYRRDTSPPTGVGIIMRDGRWVRRGWRTAPDDRDLGVLVDVVRAFVRDWIDETPLASGVIGSYTVVAINAFDPYGPPQVPEAGRASALPRSVSPGTTFETYRLALDRNALLLAAERGHHEVVAALLEAGANPASTDSGGQTALHLAAKGGHLETVKLLIRAGTPKDAVALHLANLPELAYAPTPFTHRNPEGGHTALSLVYARHVDEALFTYLLEAGASPLFGPEGALAPHAAGLGREADMERLLAAGPHPFVTNFYDQTVFTAALSAVRPNLARRLRDRAFDPSHPSWPDPKIVPLANRALIASLHSSQLETLEWLCARGADPDDENSFEFPLRFAIERGLPAPFVRALINAGADSKRVPGELISKIADPEVRAALASKPIAQASSAKAPPRIGFPWSTDTDMRNHGIAPPYVPPPYIPGGANNDPADIQLRAAAAAGNIPAIRDALKNGASIDGFDENGWTALIHAINAGKLDAARTLIDAGAMVHRATKFGSSVFAFAVKTGDRAFVDELLDLGADPNLFDRESISPLIVALNQDVKLADHLIRRGADPRFTVFMNRAHPRATPLVHAARTGNLAGVKLLVEHGVDPKTVFWRGDRKEEPTPSLTALPFAAASDDVATLDYFLALGLDPKLETAFGDNALDWALDAKAHRTAAKLRSLGLKTRVERGLPPRED